MFSSQKHLFSLCVFGIEIMAKWEHKHPKYSMNEIVKMCPITEKKEFGMTQVSG